MDWCAANLDAVGFHAIHPILVVCFLAFQVGNARTTFVQYKLRGFKFVAIDKILSEMQASCFTLVAWLLFPIGE